MAIFVRNKRIAGLIRKGLKMDVKESTQYWVGRKEKIFYACALGMAMIGKNEDDYGAYFAFNERLRNNHGDAIQTISDLLQIEMLLVEKINRLHNDGISAIDIAETLESGEGDDQCDIYPLLN